MKKLYALLMLTFSVLIFGQTGMGTPTPRGALDINRPLTNTFGLVLPTNGDPDDMVNPQGGTIAEGTIMYDSTDKCVKFFDGTAWSNCMAVGAPINYLAADCGTAGFEGTFEKGTPLSRAIFTIKITNKGLKKSKPLSFQTSDLVLSGVNGISVSSVLPVSATIDAGQSVTITYTLSGIPRGIGTLAGDWSNLSLTCSKTVSVNPGIIRVAYYGSYVIGGAQFTAFNSQLQNSANYGLGGTYNKIKGFTFTNITSTLSNLTVAQLLANYDILSIGRGSSITADNFKLSAFADAGGIVFVHLEGSGSSNLLTAFGFRAPFSYGSSGTVITNTNNINNGIFGNSINSTIQTPHPADAALLTANQVPPNTTVLATNGSNPRVLMTGVKSTAIFFWDEDVHRHSNVSGTIINTPQEQFLHNLMAYALDNLR